MGLLDFRFGKLEDLDLSSVEQGERPVIPKTMLFEHLALMLACARILLLAEEVYC